MRIRNATENLGREHPEVEVICAGHLGAHPLLAEAFQARASGQGIRQPQYELRPVQIPRTVAWLCRRPGTAPTWPSPPRARHRPTSHRPISHRPISHRHGPEMNVFTASLMCWYRQMRPGSPHARPPRNSQRRSIPLFMPAAPPATSFAGKIIAGLHLDSSRFRLVELSAARPAAWRWRLMTAAEECLPSCGGRLGGLDH